ncbi:MAG: RNA methyltransferase [Bacteroidetes bacterium RIFCSPLOWO2_12_FULL_35_15]|nr:MAG: RNA methyltransferase [Bacteroidetes bacterium RIFCSPLOWO2_12_FULL_35_15]
MKLHKTLVNAITLTLQQIFVNGVYADKAVAQVLKKDVRWGSRDRRFIAETIYEMVRWWRLIKQSAGIPEPITENDFLKLFASWQLIKGNELPDWIEFKEIDKNNILGNFELAKTIRKYRDSVPDWLDEIGTAELGENLWGKELTELNKEAQVVLRTNTLKTSAEVLQKKLAAQNIETHILKNGNPIWEIISKDALVLEKRHNLQSHDEYKLGLFEIQDASSQLIAHFMDLRSGMIVIDACAGAGGKSLHIAALMNNQGKILSMDVEEKKLIELKKRADRAGASCIQTQLINENILNKFKNAADRLLLDVPCSGLGVLRRTPDAKWKLNLDFIEQIKKKQQQILQKYSEMVKPGGIMIYATCSILPSENQNQVGEFLEKNNKQFKFIEDRKIMPSEGFDGFYMAKMLKLL